MKSFNSLQIRRRQLERAFDVSGELRVRCSATEMVTEMKNGFDEN